jgi:hypothetical protein
MRQVGTGKASVSEPLTTCRNKQMTSEPDRLNGSGMSLAGAPFTGQGRLICRSVRANNRGLPWEEAGGHVGTAGQAV